MDPNTPSNDLTAGIEEEVASILGHDAFAPAGGEPESKPEEPSAPPAKAPETKGDGVPPKGDGPAAPQPKAKDEPPEDKTSVEEEEPEAVKRLREAAKKAQPDEATQLRQTVENLQRQLSELQAGRQQAPQGQQPTQDAQQARMQEIVKMYPVQVPEQVARALLPDDAEPAQVQRTQQVLGYLTQSIAVAVHSRMEEHLAKQVQEVPKQVSTQITSEQQVLEARRKIFEDFYGAFPQLRGFESLVMTEAQNLQRETGIKTWSQDFRDAVGQRVLHAIKRLNGAQAGLAPAPVPPRQAMPGARPAASSGADSLTDDILATLR